MSQVVIHRDPEIQGGVPVFVGTRVPLITCSIRSKRVMVWISSWRTTLRFRANRRGPRWNWREKLRRSMRLLLDESRSTAVTDLVL
jgi:hypothetical protein